MDIYSSNEEFEEEANLQPSNVSDTGRQTVSTDHDHPPIKKTKTIRKQYEPIKEGNEIIRFEDNPTEYKRLRKKLQNRESAARVRGKKKGDFMNLQKEVERLQKINSELMLRNASLETENKSLREQVSFFRELVRPNENIDQYLNLDPPPRTTKKMSQQYHFEEEERWIRSPNSSSGNNSWSTLFVLTIVVCVFVIPASQTTNSVSIAQESSVADLSGYSDINLLGIGKIIVRYAIIMGYILFAGLFLKNRINWKKLKQI